MDAADDPLGAVAAVAAAATPAPALAPAAPAIAPPPLPPTFAQRAARFAADIGTTMASPPAHVVDMANLRALARSGGLPDSPPGLRATAWKLLLGILPPRPADWPAVLASKRAAYAQFCTELVLERPAGDPPPADDDCAASAPAATEDHPLSAAPSSAWRAFHEGTSIRDQIDRDVARTHPDMHFFSGLADGGGEEGGGGAAATPPPNTPATAARAALARALFVFAKLNPGVQYVQGMNELVAPPYFVFATGGGSGEGTAVPPPPTTSTTSPQPPPSAAEADAFHALVALMAECRDWFCPALDHGSSGTGVKATLGSLGRALAAADPPLAAHLLGTNGVDPQFFAFRWLTLWLTQEFALPDAVRLWDGILGAEPEGGGAGGESGGRPAWRAALERVCVAMLVAVRGELLGGDFAANLKLLQHYPPEVDVGRLLRLADEIGGTAAC